MYIESPSNKFRHAEVRKDIAHHWGKRNTWEVYIKTFNLPTYCHMVIKTDGRKPTLSEVREALEMNQLPATHDPDYEDRINIPIWIREA